MLAHRLTHVIRLQQPTESQDPVTGEITIAWSDIELSPGKPDIPAEVLTGPGKELIAAGSKYAESDARINIRWFPIAQQDLYKCRALWEGQVFDITSVETDRTARQEWRLRCKAGVNSGL